METSPSSHRAKSLQGSNSDFSIDHILNVAGGKQQFKNFDSSKAAAGESDKFEWLKCTRYRPPKLPRPGKKEGIQRRKSGRNPRIPFSNSQVAFLEAKFLRTPYLSSRDVASLASHLKLSETRVKIWFQNRRARERREKDGKSKAEGKGEGRALPSELPKCLPLGCSPSYPDSVTYLRLIAPLDLTGRQIFCGPK